MKLIQTDKESLLKQLESITRIVERRHTLPILSNVLIERKNKKISCIATDLEIQITSTTALQRTVAPGRAVIGCVKNVGPVSDAEFIHFRQQHPNRRVHVECDGCGSHASFVATIGAGLHGFVSRSQSIRGTASAVVGKLQIERLSGSNLTTHEVDATLRDSVGLLGIRISRILRPAVACGTVAFGEAVFRRMSLTHVPLAKVS